MKSVNPDDFAIVYGKGGSVAIDYDRDGKADGRPSGEPPLWMVDSKNWWSITVAVRALFSAAWHNKLAAVGLFFAALGILPFVWMGGLALLSKDARQLTNAEGGGHSGAMGNNLVVNIKNTVSGPVTSVYNDTIEANLKGANDVAFSSPREGRAASASTRR
jgi:hypothetical protein